MLRATPEEREHVEGYFLSQSKDAEVTFLQKVHSESVAGHRHDVWDVHASDGRWWVITNPTNLYSQTQFPNMDYAVTFHLGLCIRIPRTDKQRETDIHVLPFAALLTGLQNLPEDVADADELADYQAIGVKSRELLLSFIGVAQDIIKWPVEKPPQRANFREWIDIIFNTLLGGKEHEARRRLLKSACNEAWTFCNWLTHTKSATWHDAEAAQGAVEQAIEPGVSLLLRTIRLVPEECPKCGSPHLAPEEGRSEEEPGKILQRPACGHCGWRGLPVRIDPGAPKVEIVTREESDAETGACIVPNVPLTKLARPKSDED